MTVNLTTDLHGMLSDFGEPVTLPGGAVVKGIPGIASMEAAMSGDTIIGGRTRTLRMVDADASTLQEGDVLTWRAVTWRVLAIRYSGTGHAVTAFLGAAS